MQLVGELVRLRPQQVGGAPEGAELPLQGGQLGAVAQRGHRAERRPSVRHGHPVHDQHPAADRTTTGRGPRRCRAGQHLAAAGPSIRSSSQAAADAVLAAGRAAARPPSLTRVTRCCGSSAITPSLMPCSIASRCSASPAISRGSSPSVCRLIRRASSQRPDQPERAGDARGRSSRYGDAPTEPLQTEAARSRRPPPRRRTRRSLAVAEHRHLGDQHSARRRPPARRTRPRPAPPGSVAQRHRVADQGRVARRPRRPRSSGHGRPRSSRTAVARGLAPAAASRPVVGLPAAIEPLAQRSGCRRAARRASATRRPSTRLKVAGGLGERDRGRPPPAPRRRSSSCSTSSWPARVIVAARLES